MGNKINVAEILKDKPQGTKLYDLLRNIDVELDKVNTTYVGTYIECTSINEVGSTLLFDYSKLGTEKCWLEGLRILLPSKNMRDWEKFSWKKGDLLINSCGFQCIFKEWASDDYTKFNGCYSNSRDGYEDVSNAETAKFDKLDHNIAYGYVREIERELCGKLNLETLEIEKQTEFKDGDIVAVDLERKNIRIFKEKENENNFRWGKYYIGFSFNNEGKPIQTFENYRADRTSDRLATDLEKQQLFSALAKEGKAWDAEKKMIVDLKKKVELKPFDKVVVRCSESDRWSIDFFSYKAPNGYICTGDAWFGYCLPYNEETAKLIGTTINMEV